MDANRWDTVIRLGADDLQPGRSHVWGVSGDVARRIIDALAAGDVAAAGRSSEQPWVAMAVQSDRSVLAMSSSVEGSGVLWSVDAPDREAPALLLGAQLGPLVTSRRSPTTLDARFIEEYAHMRPGAHDTPYAEVRRVPPGTAAQWSGFGDRPLLREWCGPGSWPEPTLSGDTIRPTYLREFDRAIDELVVPGEPLCATMSGGLDSTFVVASLARLVTPDSPVHAFAHVPNPDAPLRTGPNWDPDDSHVAEEMERAYPGLVVMTRVVNRGERFSLDVAAEVSERMWAPAVNPGNLTWLTDMAERTAALGGSRLFMGTVGNAAFSHDHAYAARYHVRRREFGAIAAMVRQGTRHGMSLPLALRRRVVGPLTLPLRARFRRDRIAPFEEQLGLRPLQAEPTEVREGRAHFLSWLRTDSGLPITIQPIDGTPQLVDPFATAGVLDLAAAITPAAWNDGPPPRGFARLLGEGRVPDAIRLRTRRGAQSADQWYLAQRHRDRYADEVAALATTPILNEVVDVDALRRRIEGWPWGNPDADADPLLPAVDRLLALGGFVRSTVRRLQDLPTG